MLFVFFVAISAVFWCFITFNQDLQKEIGIKLEVVGIPENITFIDDLPSEINVTVKDKGSVFVKYMLTRTHVIRINFKDYADSNTEKLTVSSAKLKNLIRNTLNRSTTVILIAPESINVAYTSSLGKKVPVNYSNIVVNVTPGYIQNGRISSVTGDSVEIFANSRLLNSIDEVFTYQIDANELTDTLRRKVNLIPVSGIKIVPSSIEIVIPVEQLVECNDTVAVSIRNNPAGSRMIAFPSSVVARYHLPKSKMGHQNSVIAVVDYNTMQKGSNKVAVMVGESPSYIQDVELIPDSVQCNLIEN